MSEENQGRKRLTEEEVRVLRQKRDMAYRRKLQQLRDTTDPEERAAIHAQFTEAKRVPEKPTTVRGKWENYRYHYGGATIMIAIAVTLVVWLVYDIVTAEKYDIYITSNVCYEGSLFYDTAMETLAQYIEYDYDGDGDSDLFIDNLQLDRENIEDASSDTVMATTTKLSVALMDEGYMIYIVDDYYYDFLIENDIVFADLSAYSDSERVDGDRYLINGDADFDTVDHEDNYYIVVRDIASYDEDDQEDYQELFDYTMAFVTGVMDD